MAAAPLALATGQAQAATSLSSASPHSALGVQSKAKVEPKLTDGIPRHNYEVNAGNETAYLHVRDDGKLERVEFADPFAGDGGLYVETVSPGLSAITSQKTIDPKTYTPTGLSKFAKIKWGGFFPGSDYNFVVTGQDNPHDSDKVAVVRVTKYTKSWKYVGNIEFCGINTSEPFRSGGCSFAEYGGKLYIRTSRTMYTDKNLINHQSNLQLEVDESLQSGERILWGYVSHSFAQKVVATDAGIFAADHGDAYPRAIVVGKLGDEVKTVVPIKGSVGENSTGASLGGLEASNSAGKVLAVGNVAGQDAFVAGGYKENVPRNVWLATMDTVTLETSTRMLTSFKRTAKKGASTPFIVKVNDDRFLVLWEKTKTSGKPIASPIFHGWIPTGKVNYLFVDGLGNPLSKVYSAKAQLGGCQPVVYKGKAVWYSKNYRASEATLPAFYSIDASSGKLEAAKRMKRVANTLRVKTLTVHVQAKDLKRGSWFEQAMWVEAAQGKVSFRKTGGSKAVSVVGTNGRIRVAQGTAKGKYRIKVAVKAKGNKSCRAGTKKATVKVVVH